MFQINYCDYNVGSYDRDIISRANGSGDYLLLLIHAPMDFTIDGQVTEAKEHGFILYTPGTMQYYQARKEFRNSYIHFSAKSNYVEQYNIPTNTVFYPNNYEDINQYIKDIVVEYLTKDIFYISKSNTLMEQLFISIARYLRQSGELSNTNLSLYYEFQKARLQILSTCEQPWDVPEMCSLVNLSKSQFFSYYKTFFNSTPKAELIQARIEKAKNLLTNDTMLVRQVASLCGFQNIYHFTRYFNEICGCSPGNYAKIMKERPWIHPEVLMAMEEMQEK